MGFVCSAFWNECNFQEKLNEYLLSLIKVNGNYFRIKRPSDFFFYFVVSFILLIDITAKIKKNMCRISEHIILSYQVSKKFILKWNVRKQFNNVTYFLHQRQIQRKKKKKKYLEEKV